LEPLRIKILSAHDLLVTIIETLEYDALLYKTPKTTDPKLPTCQNLAIARTTISQKEESLERQTSQIEKLPGGRTCAERED
jgi:hypothetical protein